MMLTQLLIALGYVGTSADDAEFAVRRHVLLDPVAAAVYTSQSLRVSTYMHLPTIVLTRFRCLCIILLLQHYISASL